MVQIFVMASVVRRQQFNHCSVGTRASEGLNKPTAPRPEHMAEPSAVVMRRKRLFLVSECEISPPQGDINILGH